MESEDDKILNYSFIHYTNIPGIIIQIRLEKDRASNNHAATSNIIQPQ